MPLRDLFTNYYGYPTERWNCDEIFEELLVDYISKFRRVGKTSECDLGESFCRKSRNQVNGVWFAVIPQKQTSQMGKPEG